MIRIIKIQVCDKQSRVIYKEDVKIEMPEKLLEVKRAELMAKFNGNDIYFSYHSLKSKTNEKT